MWDGTTCYNVNQMNESRWHFAKSAIPVVALLFIAAGFICGMTSRDWSLSHHIWQAGLLVTGAPIVFNTLRGMLRGRFAADVVAFLAIIAAVALDQPVVGLVIVLMQSGGEFLERYAEGRASEALRELEAMAPRLAHLVTPGEVVDVLAEDVKVGDTLLLKPGELVPCDSVVIDGRSHVDASRLTGEAVPITATPGTRLMSGSINSEGAITLKATAISRESQYARIVELVRSAEASKSPLQRTADRYAVWFTPLTVGLCAATWIASRDPMRVLAILAVATPCPLIIATPVAVLGGINRAARRQIIVRNGTALERVGETTVAIFDKTGTITIGEPRVSRVRAIDPLSEAEVLSLASAVEQGSSHLLARTLIAEAVNRGLNPPIAANIIESPGRGVSGFVDGRRVTTGSLSFIREMYPLLSLLNDAEPHQLQSSVKLTAYVAVDGQPAGTIDYADALRAGAPALFTRLAALGIRRTILLSGDHAGNVRAVANQLSIAEFEGDLLPQDKVSRVAALTKQGERVLMVGDGTNDAPALSAATVGIALASRGGGISAEAADIVLLTDELSRVAEAIEISRRTMRIANQGIRFGLGISLAAMVAAACGYIPPIAGAMLQEGVDLAVILNALRASRQR